MHSVTLREVSDPQFLNACFMSLIKAEYKNQHPYYLPSGEEKLSCLPGLGAPFCPFLHLPHLCLQVVPFPTHTHTPLTVTSQGEIYGQAPDPVQDKGNVINDPFQPHLPRCFPKSRSWQREGALEGAHSKAVKAPHTEPTVCHQYNTHQGAQ